MNCRRGFIRLAIVVSFAIALATFVYVFNLKTTEELSALAEK